METIPSDVARKLLNRDFANLVKRVQAGGKISRAERAMLESIAAGAPSSEPSYARNLVELAMILKVTRQTLHAWKRMDDAPKTGSNGLHDVVAWRDFMRKRGLRSNEDQVDVQQALKARKLLAEVEERELRLAVKRGDYVAVETVRKQWSERIGAARLLLEGRLLNELPPVLSGRDAHGIREELERCIQEFYALLHGDHGDAS